MRMFSLKNGTRRTIPRVPFSRIAEKMTGRSYELSVAFVGDRRMRRLNRTYRNSDRVTDVLAFPLGEKSGEILLNLRAVEKKSKAFGLSPRNYLTFVFIHGILHLKGLTHGRTMEKLEDTWCRKFGVPHKVR